MRFKIKTTAILGEYRYITRFAFIPKRAYSYGMKEEYYIWLEFYIEEQQYIQTKSNLEGTWVTKWNYCKKDNSC